MIYFESIKTFITGQKLESLCDVYLIGVQHLLSTTGSLIERIIHDGILAKNIFLTGKIYSTNIEVKKKLQLLGVNIVNPSVYNRPGFFEESLVKDVEILWIQLKEKLPYRKARIIILDDGGYTIKSIPEDLLKSNHQIIGIEQTSSGAWKLKNASVPVINVAQSVTKLYLEPYIVKQALIKKIEHILQNITVKRLGVISCGAIGDVIINHFSRMTTVHIYDKDLEKMGRYKSCIKHRSALSLYKACNVIIGCTGRDVSDSSWISNTEENKLLISASSGDIEFLSLLRVFSNQNKYYHPLDTFKIKVKENATISLFRGGTVANFDGSPHSAPTNEIQLTRGLLYAAFIQALKLSKEYQKGLIKLNAQYQKQVVELWFNDQPQMKENYPNVICENFQSEDWIINNS